MFFAKLHPLLVQFPLALLASGVLLEIYGKSQREETVIIAGRFNLQMGFWCALVAAVVGALGLSGLHVKQKSALGYHVFFACATIILFAAALRVQRVWNKKPGTILYFILLISGFLSVLATGYLGGELVYRFGIGTLHPIE
ncbi:MAG: hypothetical protein A3K09_01870 [Nitrospinae bacterium RIFCSPLOWO2_12_FULL_47_7]|nr:MAG: hypothetical protein A3K09_01870 [Nitrospinae bacterium RIFCSPLOWO2_12_FULL_47_7]